MKISELLRRAATGAEATAHKLAAYAVSDLKAFIKSLPAEIGAWESISSRFEGHPDPRTPNSVKETVWFYAGHEAGNVGKYISEVSLNIWVNPDKDVVTFSYYSKNHYLSGKQVPTRQALDQLKKDLVKQKESFKQSITKKAPSGSEDISTRVIGILRRLDKKFGWMQEPPEYNERNKTITSGFRHPDLPKELSDQGSEYEELLSKIIDKYTSAFNSEAAPIRQHIQNFSVEAGDKDWVEVFVRLK